MTARLDGKIAIITGAANGMGAAFAAQFVHEGAQVLIGDVDETAGAELAGRLGESAVFHRLDVTDPAAWEAAIAAANDAFGAVDVLVNNAGVSGDASRTVDIDDTAWARTIAIDLTGTFNGVRAVIPQMIDNGGGSIINISSAAGMAAASGVNAAYVAAKFGVRGLTKQIAVEYGAQNIRANSVHPGAVRTALTQALVDQLGPQFMEQFYAAVPMKRIAEVDEVVQPVVFLASGESSFINGTEIVIDGGLLAE